LLLNLSNHVAGVTAPVPGMVAYKVGRTTGLTFGKVVDPNSIVTLTGYGPPTDSRSFTNIILLQRTKISGCCCCTCNVVDASQNFSEPGDSGSAVVNEQRMAIGLHMGGGGGESYACRMSEVESGLNITINRTVVVGPQSLVVPASGAVPAGSGGVGVPQVAAGAPVSDETVWSIMQRRMEESPLGRELSMQIRHHLPECINLVNHHRAVMVTWQRVQGPSFLAQWMNGVRNPSLVVPKEINSVTMNSALLRLAAVLKEFGSESLQQSIDNYGLDLMEVLDRSASVDELLEKIGKPVLA
ncbi:MAG: hypothetical protein H7Z40_13970, partial [Phycisphaerae bacterium]|nr:hypothetical protein [Gemmatimonadaceae bacterium]